MRQPAAAPPRAVGHVEPVMGTVVSFWVLPGPLPDHAAADAIAAACDVLHRADAVFSTWNPHSPVSRFRRGDVGLADLPQEVSEVLRQCREARQLTGGWFDPWACPGGVDPTGLVKGWAVDRAATVLREAGMAAAMVNAGGDIRVFGSPGPRQGWRIGIRHPWRPDALAAVVCDLEAAIATSGSYERGQHLFSPFPGRGNAAASATVTGPVLAMADALATALAVGGTEVLARIARLDGYHALLIRADGSQSDTGGISYG